MAQKRRNILFILTDQHRADAIGCYGNTICQTPNLDELASRYNASSPEPTNDPRVAYSNVQRPREVEPPTWPLDT